MSASGGTASANIRYAQLRVEAPRRAVRQASQIRARPNHNGVPLGEALVATHALLQTVWFGQEGVPKAGWLGHPHGHRRTR